MNFFAPLLVSVLVAYLNVCDSTPFKNASAIDPAEKGSLSWRLFQSFRRKYGKKYESPCEEQERYRIFKENLKKIERLNAEEKGTAVYGVNEMADWSGEEFLKRRANLKQTDFAENSKCMKKVNFTTLDNDDPIPDEFDLRSTLSVTSVKHQRDCGSSWAFATVGNIENIHAIQKGFLQDYSVQQLVDCSKKALGCVAGTLTSGFETVIDMGGLVPESKYPYTAVQSDCKFSQSDVTVEMEGFVVLESHDEAGMAGYVATRGSTCNGINAEMIGFYQSGIVVAKDGACSEDKLSHMVVVVGYGRDPDSGLDFWAVKNSWGPDWGEAGYFRVARGRNTCGIAKFISSAKLKDEAHDNIVTKSKAVEGSNF